MNTVFCFSCFICVLQHSVQFFYNTRFTALSYTTNIRRKIDHPTPPSKERNGGGGGAWTVFVSWSCFIIHVLAIVLFQTFSFT